MHGRLAAHVSQRFASHPDTRPSPYAVVLLQVKMPIVEMIVAALLVVGAKLLACIAVWKQIHTNGLRRTLEEIGPVDPQCATQ